ncbi:MAG TPA: hydroxyacid dehydrogenase [Calditrichia bacterium]|nr:hydroxyacid dehydrogenase [Calditrichota bacterium]HQV31491.1 hydroxyacid dehydrogenase [Calditrichia bacterium]
MSYRIFLTGSGIAEAAREHLRNNNCVFETGDPKDTPEDLIRKLDGFRPHALIVRQGKISREVQAAAPDLKVICKHGVGTDNIDIEAATERGIPVLFTPNANYQSAAEHTVALLFALSRNVVSETTRIRGGLFDKKLYSGLELGGKTLGIVGYGKIARRFAELVAPLGMTILVYHPSGRAEYPPYLRRVGDPEELIREADVISLHCPLNAETREMINRETISRMKTGAMIINTARGELIREADLVEALGSGKLRGAALDVFAQEPPEMSGPLFQLDNVILSTHVAGMSDRSTLNMAMESAANVLAILNGQAVDPASVKNPGALED